MIEKLQTIQATIETLASEYAAHYTWAVRWDEPGLPVGHVFPPSRVWVDGEPTEETLPGTSAIAAKDLQRVVSRMNYYTGQPYIVCGELSLYGEDLGEVILRDCEVIAIG